MKQELPLTPAMIDYAQSPVFRKGNHNVLSLLTVVLMLSFTAPAFLTAVTVLQHRPLGLGAAIVWLLFGLFGTALFYLGLRAARLVRRDLANGVYVRWTGPFTTRVVNIGYRGSKGLVVEAGGRKLATGRWGTWWRQVAGGYLRLASTPAPSITFLLATLCARSELSRALCCGASSLGASCPGPPRLRQHK